MNGSWDVLVDGLARPEAPCPDGAGGLWFSEIAAACAIMRLDPDGSVHTVCAGRAHVGGIVPHADGGLVASGPTVAVIDRQGVARDVLDADGGWGFNDITTDAVGNVFAGKHAERPQMKPPAVEASLWRVGTDSIATHCYDGILMTNGLRVSPDGSRLYHADTLRELVWVSDLDDAGLPQHRRVHYVLRTGMPDGMAIDEAGCVWIAAIGAGAVVRVAPNGTMDRVVEVPRSYVSAVCFGGADRRELIVTAFGGDPYDTDHAGCVLSMGVDVAGFPVPAARV